MELQTESLNSTHIRENFDCGNEILDNYLKKLAKQDVKRKLSACFVICETVDEKNIVKGYYTLSNYGIPRETVPDAFKNKFPSAYKTIPTTLLGRLARDKGISIPRAGEFLLMDALYRSYLASLEVASFAIIVDPIDEKAISFYEKYGFKLLPDSQKMFIAMKTVEQLFV